MKLPLKYTETMKALLGAEYDAYLASFDEERFYGLRVNTLKISAEEMAAKGVFSLRPVPWCETGFYYDGAERPAKHPYYHAGLYYLQEPSAMSPAATLPIGEGDRVLDLCAAPGGKTTQLGARLGGTGLLVANDISAGRAKTLLKNVELAGIRNAIVMSETPERIAERLPHFFDKILVDAPCSGEGMFRKDPAAMQYWSPEYVLTCQTRQKEILTQAMKMLKPSGELVYSTCTYSPEEDEEIVAWLVENYHLKIEPLKLYPGMSMGKSDWSKSNLPELKDTVRLWFQNGVGEGQFIAHLRSTEAVEDASGKVKKRKKKHQKKSSITRLTKDEITTVAKVLDDFVLPDGLENWQKTVLQSNGHVFVPAVDPELLNELHILNNGVELGLLKKKRFEPSHQLAEVLGQKEQKQLLNLKNETDYEHYLHGETIKVNSELRGFVLVAYKTPIFSFGKIGNDQILKNFYPKGLRK